MFQGLFAIVYKETRHIVRDPRSLFLMLVIPSIELIIFGFAVNLDIKNIRTGILNQDKKIESRNLIDQFINSGYFDVVEIFNNEEEMATAMRRGDVRVGIHIPPYYTDRVLKNEYVSVQILIDGSDSTVAMQALNVSNAIGLRASIKILDKTKSLPSQFPIDMRPRVLFNPDMRTANFMIPGLCGVILQVVIMLLTSFAIVKEKEQRTLEQLVVTPVSRFGLMLGKLIPFLGVGICETASVLFLMRFLFQVPIAGSVLLLAFFAGIFLFTTLGMGLLVSTFAQNQIQALQISFLILLPSFLLSGFMFPQETMPQIIYWFGQIVPATYFIRILRGIILRNAGFWDLWHNGAILGAMGIIILFIASFRFHKTIG